MSMLYLTVNGEAVEVNVPETRYLADVLREDLRMTGTKVGCNEAECGICTVLVNGLPVDSCIFPAFKAQYAEVETIEGLGRDGELHPLQQAFLDESALECGYCTPGMILSALELLEANPSPSEAEIVRHMDGNICRCGTYTRIREAIQRAAEDQS